MKRFLATLAVFGLAATSMAQQPLLVPTPEPTLAAPQLVEPTPPATRHRTLFRTQPVAAEPTPTPIPDAGAGVPVPYDQVFPTATPALRLYEHVRVKQARNIAPCAQPKLVAIKDPCFPCSGNCVYVEVCVPPCEREEVCCSRRGDKIRLDYGKYSVDIETTRRGLVVIDYND